MEFEDFLLMSKIVWHYSQSKYSMLVTEDLFGPQTSYNNYASSLQHMYLLYKDFQLFKCFPSNAAVENLHISQMGNVSNSNSNFLRPNWDKFTYKIHTILGSLLVAHFMCEAKIIINFKNDINKKKGQRPE